jgi:two-component system, NtrC family, sensor kinase
LWKGGTERDSRADYDPNRVLTNLFLGVFVLAAVVAGALAGLALAIPIALVAAATAVFFLNTARRHQLLALERLLDSRMIQAQKMAALGEISSGIAHEINNPLAIISQEVELMRHYLKASGPFNTERLLEVEGSVSQIDSQVNRCREITHRLLTLARKMDPVLQAVDLSRLVEDMVLLVEREALTRGVSFIREYGQGMSPSMTDPPLVRQVVLNLLNNAVQAIDGNGTVTVRTGEDEGFRTIEVEDTGCGIEPEQMLSIFNPFYTTKPPGQGTGLGLSISNAIMARLGGEIAVESEPGRGARFTLRLPKEGAHPRGLGEQDGRMARVAPFGGIIRLAKRKWRP